MLPNKSRYGNNSFRIKTVPTNTQLYKEQPVQFLRNDSCLYHKPLFHLQPRKNNPELLALLNPIKTMSAKKVYDLKKTANNFSEVKIVKEPVLPASINIRQQLMKMNGIQKALDKILQEDTKVLVTAKKWIIFDMENNKQLKGYKFKKQHDLASLTKILTFYTAYMMIKKYFLSPEKVYFLATEYDCKIQGTKLKLQNQNLLTIQDLLYAMMLNSANNAATILANNLGSYIHKKKTGSYFSCFDIPQQNRQRNTSLFVEEMNFYAEQIGLDASYFQNVHGLYKNKSTAKDIAILTSQCYKIPLFRKIVTAKTKKINVKYISNEGEQRMREITLKNTNKLLQLNSGCIGGKTGWNKTGGDSLVACYEGNIIVVVLGCHGSEQKFADCQRLIGWLYKKIQKH